MTQSIQKQIGFIAAVESKRHLRAVGLEMLRADSMPRTHDSALEKRECGFNRVGIDVAFRVDAEFVPDSLVPTILPNVLGCASISLPIIRVQDVHIFADILADVLFERAALGVFGMKETQIAAALTNADHNFFPLVQRILALPPIFPADVGFVHLYLAVEHRLLTLDHCRTDAMAEIPCRLVASESKRSLNLAGRHALLRFTEKQCCDEPFRQRQVRVIEDRSCRHGKLIVAILAVEDLLVGFEPHDWHLAAWALRASGPAKPDKQFAALFIGREHGVYVN